MSQYKNWKLDTDAEEITWLGADAADTSVNILNGNVLDELNNIIEDISNNSTCRGLVIYSVKKNGFIAGADVNEFAHFKDSQQILDFLYKGQNIFTKLEALKIPTVAMIDGFCMGGGLELALACDYRITTDSKKNKVRPTRSTTWHSSWLGRHGTFAKINWWL